MSDKLTQLAVNYARAHSELRAARRAYQLACSDMQWPLKDDGTPDRKFFQFNGDWKYDSGHARYHYGDRVEDCKNLIIIARWKEAYTAKVAAARKLGAIRGAILKHGKRLIKERAK